jgi:hypothetical protein
MMVGAVFLITATGLCAWAAEAVPFDVGRLVVCEQVQDREPVGVSGTFSSETTRVYAFLEALNISADADVDFVWYHAGSELTRVTLPVRQGSRWRTYASKNLYDLTGTWWVEVQDETGAVIGSVQFEVE